MAAEVGFAASTTNPFTVNVAQGIAELPLHSGIGFRVIFLVCVVIAAGATVWLALVIATAMQVPLGGFVLIPAMLVGYIVWRVIADRLRSKEDDHYDRIER